MPTFSVVIPTFQRPKLLREAVRSVLAQTFADFEVIVVEDGVQDGQDNALDAINDARVRHIIQEHAGRSAARNRGIAEARGEWIAFLDDDDLYLPNKMASEISFLNTHPCVDLVACGTSVTTIDGVELQSYSPRTSDPSPTLLDLLNGCMFATCGVTVRKEALAQMDVCFDPALEYAEDWDFYLRLGLTGAQMAWLPEILSVYRGYRREAAELLLEMNRSGKQVLDRFFARPDLSPEVLERKNEAYTRFHLSWACRAYVCQASLLAQRELLRALRYQPLLADECTGLLEAEISRYSKEPAWQGTPEAYRSFVFGHLPSPLARQSARWAAESRATGR